MAAEILRGRVRLAHNSSGANLVSGVASTLLAARGAELGLFEVDEAALPEVAARVRPRAVCLGNLFRDQLDRYGELELVAERLARGGAGAAGRGGARRQRRRSRRSASSHATVPARSCSASTIPSLRAAVAPARGRLEVLRSLRHALRVRRGVRRAPRRLPLSRLRARAPAARRRRARDRAARARGRRVLARDAGRGRARRACALPGPLQRLQRARRRGARAARSARRSTRSPPGSSASAPRSGASSGSRSATGGC